MTKTTDGDAGGDDGGKGDDDNICVGNNDGGATDNNQLKRQQMKRRWLRLRPIVETVGTDVSAAAAWTPCLRFVRCWLLACGGRKVYFRVNFI